VHRAECSYVDAFKALAAKESTAASRLLLTSRVAAACETDAEKKRRVDLLEDFRDTMVTHAGGALAAYDRIDKVASAPGFVACDEGFELAPCSVPAAVQCKVHTSSLSLPGPGNRSIVALVPAVSLCAHSCLPNCHAVHEGAGIVTLRALSPISPGDEVQFPTVWTWALLVKIAAPNWRVPGVSHAIAIDAQAHQKEAPGTRRHWSAAKCSQKHAMRWKSRRIWML